MANITLTNGQTIPEESILFTVSAPIDNGIETKIPISLVQYDTSFAVIGFSILYKNSIMKLDNSYTISIRMKKPDGKEVYDQVIGFDQNNTAYILVTQQMTTAFGEGEACLELISGNNRKSTKSVPVYISENPVSEKNIESTDEYKTIVEITAEVQQAAQLVQSQATNLQQAAAAAMQSAADAAGSAETASTSASTAAQSAGEASASAAAATASEQAAAASQTAAAQSASAASGSAQAAAAAQAAAMQSAADAASSAETAAQQLMDEYEALQTQWFDSIRDKLSGDVATKLQKEEGFVAKDISFSPDGKHITETSGTLRRETVFNTDGSITEKLYDNDILIHTKNTTFSADGSNIKEEVS